MDNYIDITGCDLIALVKKAYALSRAQGMGFLHFQPGDLSDEEAQKIVDNPHGIGMDYVKGRAVKLGVLKKDGRLWVQRDWYDHTKGEMRELMAAIGITMPDSAD
ncbi:hypothetical protein [Tardiphaga sp. 862_B3_N1_1]|uniref:hypothetical protein n=1 Tax=Tardiphaga sp. 862_B3_N1_1 TaxID=3240763 RepID=UPI003F8861FA